MVDDKREGTIGTVEPIPQRLCAASPKPLFYLHIPKTAGASFLLMLRNAFGDARVRRIETVDANAKATIDAIVEGGPGKVSCLAGHLPLWLMDDHRRRFQTFTILREPVARALSLARFLKSSGRDNLTRLGLGEKPTLDEFLTSRHPELWAQFHNGMARMLSGDRRQDRSDCPEFWDLAAEPELLSRAVANLERLDFGLTEDMEGTLNLARARWAAPYALRASRENAGKPDDERATDVQIATIKAINALDVALYERAEAIFRERRQALTPPAPGASWNPRMVFAAPLHREVSVAEIAGRQGFYEFERDGFAWLRSVESAAIAFTLRAPAARLRLYCYCVAPDYPARDVAVAVNGAAVSCRFTFEKGQWGWLETETFPTLDGLNRLTLEAPSFVRPSTAAPEETRALGLAVAKVALTL